MCVCVEKNCVPLGINNRKAADNTSLLSLVNNLCRRGIDDYSLPRSAVSNGPPGNSHKVTANSRFLMSTSSRSYGMLHARRSFSCHAA